MQIEATNGKRISEAIVADLKLELHRLITEYYESAEFKAAVSEKLEEYKKLEVLVNEMGDKANLAAHDEKDLKAITIYIKGSGFIYNWESLNFVFDGDMESTARWYVKNVTNFDSSWTMERKHNYIKSQVLGIVATLDDSITFDAAKSKVLETINLKEILFNNNIC